MPIDPSIYNSVDNSNIARLAQLADPAYQRAQKLKQYQDEDALTAIEEGRALKEILRTEGTNDYNILAQKAMQSGNVSAANAFAKQAAEQAKARQESELNAAKIKEIHGKLLDSNIGFAYNNPSDDNMMRVLESRGVPRDQWSSALAGLPSDAEGRRAMLRDSALKMSDRAPKPQVVGGSVVDMNPVSNPNVIGSQVVPALPAGTLPSGAMTPEKYAQQLQIARAEAEARANAGGVPMTIIPTEQGLMQVPTRGSSAAKPIIGPDGRPVAASPKASNITEGERKAATLLSRLEFSGKQLDQALKESPTSAKQGVSAAIVGGIPLIGEVASNLITPQARQRVEAAQLDMLDAALTLSTGAAYTKEQLKGHAKSYFPQIGDDPDTVKDKQVRLKNIIESARIAAGRAASQAPNMAMPAAESSSKNVLDAADEILKGGR